MPVIAFFLFSLSFIPFSLTAAQSTLPDVLERGFSPRESDGCAVEPYNSPALAEAFAPFDTEKAKVYRYRRQYGVNLGSWFINENWMTPSMFKCASGPKLSELDIANGWGSPQSAQALLERHWDNFITKDDLSYLSSIGINTVRLPIGYWHLGPQFCAGTPFQDVASVYQNAWNRIVKVVNMAHDLGLGVLVDLHGAVGSQNGQPHSGVSDGYTGLFNSPTNMEKTLTALTYLTQQLASVTNVVGIQLLNEPMYDPNLESFYGRALDTLRRISPDLPLYLHNGFDCRRFRQMMLSRSDFVVEDHHSYFVFTPSDASKAVSAHVTNIQTSLHDELSGAFRAVNSVIGEWSCALTPASLGQEEDPAAAQRQFCAEQRYLYDNSTSGWYFWAYKKEECDADPGWCFRRAVNDTLPSAFFSFGASPPNRDISSEISNLSPRDMASANMSQLGSQFPVHAPRDRSHRFSSVHHRRQEDNLGDLYQRGYMEGFSVAKTFAQQNLSRVGFQEQYIRDHGDTWTMPLESQGTYRDGFKKGLADGETSIISLLYPKW